MYCNRCGQEIPTDVDHCVNLSCKKATEQARIKGEIIRLAAVLVQCHYLPSDMVDDYPQKTYTAGRVAEMMEKAHKHSKDLAGQLRNLSNKLAG